MSRTIRTEAQANEAMGARAFAQSQAWTKPAPKRAANAKRSQSTIRAIVRAIGF